MGFVVDKVALRQVFSRILRFPLPIFISSILSIITITYHLGLVQYASSGRSTKRLSLTPLIIQKNIRRGLISLWVYKENNNVRDWKNVFTLYNPPPWAPLSYDFVVLTSLTHPRKILLVVLQIGEAKDLSALLRRHEDYSALVCHAMQFVTTRHRIPGDLPNPAISI
jgi:hypothetical protein